jgi:hypothetical protein
MILRVRFNECFFIMGNPPIARVQDDPGPAAQFIRQRQRLKPWRECYGGRVAFQANPSLRNTTIYKSPGLIQAQHFERIDATSPKLRETQ